MKKLLTLLWLTITAFTFKATAQSTICNAEFAVQYLTNYTVKFNPVITEGAPLVHHYWNFGDGSAGNQQVSPTHTYAATGTYAVVHTIVRVTPNNAPVCTQTFTRFVHIIAACNLVADFSWTSTAANPLTIAFQNLSVPLSNTDSIKWTFGDGSTSTAVNPVHTYNVPGTYTVCLRVKKLTPPGAPPCVREICKTIVVTPPCNIVPNFTWTVTPTNPLRIEFNNTSTNTAATDSIRWTFGDGSSSNQMNPVHTYTAPGTYTVCLKIIRYYSNTTTPCIREICKTIVIPPPCNLVVNFTSQPDPNNALRIKFTNTSVPVNATDSLFWTFGDGTSLRGVQGDPNVAAPTHTYANAGSFNVCLVVKKHPTTINAPCIRYICRTIVVHEPCTLVVNFTSQPDPNHPLRIKFTNTSTPIHASDSVRWTFGDGTSVSGLQSDPNVANPTHNYANAGTYTVCLRIKKNNLATPVICVREKCNTIVVLPPCNLVVNFTSQADPTNPLRIKFTNTSTPIHPSDSLKWTFGDGTSLSGVQSNPAVANPIHNYSNPGTYVVCLRVKKNNNSTPASICVREKCNTIVIPVPCTLVVNFTSQPDPTNPLRIKFTNTSTPIHPSDSLRWTFGDGTSLSGVQSNPAVANPIHNYTSPGAYTVCLRIKKNSTLNTPPTAICVREKCNTIVIPVPCNLVVNFTSQPDPNNPLRIKFTNTSVPIAPTDSLKWTFGDGTSLTGVQSNPNVASPTHNYANAGSYTVCLTVKKHPTTINTPCIRTVCKTIVVHAPPPCNLVVNFTSQPDPNHPLRIKFTNTSTPIHPSDSLRWTFGDGTSLSGVQSDPNVAAPTHNYTSAGNYTVCLRVKKNMNAPTPVGCVREKCSTIVVTPPCNFNVNFSWRLDSVNQRKVYFTNLSTPPTAAAIAVWTFGDGSSATSWNAIHEYAQPGSYRVCLRIYPSPTSNCVREFCDTVIVPHPAPPCTQLSKYHYQVFSNDNQKYKFTPDYINTALQYTWTFGDGTGSQDPIAIHRYAQPGVYVACLTVWRGPNCASTTCKEIRVLPQINCDTAHVSYTYQRNPQMPNKIQFHANATLPILDQTWTITKMPGGPTVVLHQNNPVYTFQDTGLYRVCLRAVLLGGCVKEYCNYIRIEQITTACLLQAFPNPASTTVNVNVYLTQPEMIHGFVYNSQNVLVLTNQQQGHTGNNLVTLGVHNLPAGQYTIKLVYGNRVCHATFQKL